jgi:hypothetical protein
MILGNWSEKKNCEATQTEQLKPKICISMKILPALLNPDISEKLTPRIQIWMIVRGNFGRLRSNFHLNEIKGNNVLLKDPNGATYLPQKVSESYFPQKFQLFPIKLTENSDLNDRSSQFHFE